MNPLENYLKSMFGDKISVKPYSDYIHFPRYLNDYFEFSTLYWSNDSFVIAKPLETNISFDIIVKQMKDIGSYTDRKAILYLDFATKKQRLYLIKNNVPFIVPQVAIYIPNSTVYIEETNVAPIEYSNKFTAAEQLIFLYLFYQPSRFFTGLQLAKILSLSSMTVSRTLRFFLWMQIIKLEGCTPRQKYIRIMRRDYYNIGKKYLIDPVFQKKILFQKYFKVNKYLISGDEALSSMSNIDWYDGRKTYAVYKDQLKNHLDDAMEEYELYAQNSDLIANVEFWKYNPFLLTKTRYVDSLSLVAKYQSEREDPRIDEACQKIEESECME